MSKRGKAKPFSTRHLLLRYLPIRVGGFLIVAIGLFFMNGPATGPIVVLLLGAVWGVSTILTYNKCSNIHDRLMKRPASNYRDYFDKAVEERRVNTLIDGHYAVVRRDFKDWLRP